ncbi:uncharacterized protein LOC100648546 [Bombus terrestris]|uniref:Uncharacterized protein LOC100648546 n=1 Tax=Bombus terrestris TaxID=30195 RepID=A0A9C6W7U6_BOMTE|nr:uncharacterized protein LOC100648546 [Bombus terrestris]XP_048265397.1 uncharacterized protein LOC100648546 [Bombus terrestris]XP_048265401.1 uncharacterized protein LOC100648546 [Bombus terrestris]
MTGWRMRPTASALGVVAIVSIMITAMPSEADSGAIEPSINHFGVDEEGHRIQEDERIANQTVASDLTAVVFRVHVNDTNNETPVTKTIHSFLTDHENLVNVSRMDEGSVAELQRDQSNLLSVTVSQNDVHEPQHNPLGSDAKSAERNSSENKVEHANNDFVSSTRPNRAEIASSIVPLEIRSPGSKNDDYLHGVQVDDEDLSNVVEHENELIDGSNVDKSRRENSIRFTTVSIRETIVTEVKPIEQKNVEDIRAISFQVPAIDKEAEDADKRQQDNEHPRNVMESRKDQSRPMNNLLLAGGKSTKAFYEIKPSIKTEMEPDQLNPSSTQRPLPGRKFVLPSVDSAFGKFGPYFEDGDQEINITARIGSTMLLDCKIGMLGNKEVTWVQQPSKDSFRLLTVGRILYSADQRISLNFRYPSNWRLQIQYATTRDSGLYKCQVATHPPLVKTINVVVTAPELTITDDSGRVVSKERHLKAGSVLKLRCEARDVIESLKESVIWTRGDETLTEDVSENRTTEILAGKEVLVIVSTLIVERASPRHAGNYSCVVPGKAKTTVAVHVLNGELPAAVHDGNGVSRAFLNLWLIHLTMSYVFSR